MTSITGVLGLMVGLLGGYGVPTIYQDPPVCLTEKDASETTPHVNDIEKKPMEHLYPRYNRNVTCEKKTDFFV